MIDSFREARSLAISFIGISHKSSGKIIDFLRRKDVEESLFHDVLQSLMDDGYIDDLRIARSIILSRRGRKSEGCRALKQRMYFAGIPDEVILESEQYMSEDSLSINELFEEKLLPELRKLILSGNFDAENWMNRSIRFLIARGYSTSLAVDTLRKRIRDVE